MLPTPIRIPTTHPHSHTTAAARCASKSLVCTLVCMPADELTSFGPLDTTAIRTRISGQCSSGATCVCVSGMGGWMEWVGVRMTNEYELDARTARAKLL